LIFLPVARKIICPLIAPAFLIIFLLYNPCSAQDKEETYDISLVKTAELGSKNKVSEIEGKKVLTESYTVKEGEHLWQILREKDLLKKRNLVELLSILKKLNGSLGNIDMIHPGDKIVIPLAISPVGTASAVSEETPPETIPLQALKDIDMDEYVVKKGDSVIKVVEDLYGMSDRDLYNGYLDQLKKLNPSIKDLNNVYPGQKIRLPIYSAKVVRLPIMPNEPVSEQMTEAQKENIKLTGNQLGEIFTLIGEQWLHTGEHFFPLKTGGELKLNAESYPIIDLRTGKKVIVDLYNDLPEKMGNLITSNWDNYCIVHLEGKDDLKQAFDRTVILCGYKKVYGPGEQLASGGEIPLTIAADRIIEIDQESSPKKKSIVAINFCNEGIQRTPAMIVNYLKSSGVEVIDYPPLKASGEIPDKALDVREIIGDRYSLVETLLTLTGKNFSKNVELPVYQSKKADLNLIIKADFSTNIGGRDYIIDLSGLGQDIIGLLKEHQFMVHSFSKEKAPYDIVTGTLDFLGVKYESKSHQFFSAERQESKNIILNIKGISFKDNASKNIFATSLKLPKELVYLLNLNGYSVLQLPVDAATSNGDQNN